jgi:hypothetical protein
MTRLSVRVVVCASFATMVIGIGAVSAQDCKEEVTASGKARLTEGWARSLASHMWQRQVQAQFGEQYEDIKSARDVNFVCSPTTLGKRCTLTARPCMVAGTRGPEGSGDRNADADHRPWRDDDRHEGDLTRDLQKELQRVGCYDGPIDGDWGDGSRRALERFARRADTSLDIDRPSRKALKTVEDVDRRVCR